MNPAELLGEIARHHSEIAGLVRSLRVALGAGDHPRAKTLLVDLETLEARHYATEETLMRAVQYRDAHAHQAQHALMLDTLARINQTLALENFATVSPRIVAHLEEALGHMAEADEQLDRFVAGVVQTRNS